MQLLAAAGTAPGAHLRFDGESASRSRLPKLARAPPPPPPLLPPLPDSTTVGSRPVLAGPGSVGEESGDAGKVGVGMLSASLSRCAPRLALLPVLGAGVLPLSPLPALPCEREGESEDS